MLESHLKITKNHCGRTEIFQSMLEKGLSHRTEKNISLSLPSLLECKPYDGWQQRSTGPRWPPFPSPSPAQPSQSSASTHPALSGRATTRNNLSCRSSRSNSLLSSFVFIITSVSKITSSSSCFFKVPPSLLKYTGGNGALNPLFGAQQVAVLNQLTQLNHLTQLNQISQLQVQ